MENIGFIWKISYTVHIVLNSVLLGMFFTFLIAPKKILTEEVVSSYLKIAAVFLGVSGITGIILLTILTNSGLEDLFSSSVGRFILAMMASLFVVFFTLTLTLLYKGDEVSMYRKLFFIMFVSYLLVYLIKGIFI